MAPQRPPSVDRLARSLATTLPRRMVVEVARAAIGEAARTGLDPAVIASETVGRLEAERLRPVVNATGVLLHTNLGRAPLHPEAAGAAFEAGTGYGNLELDLGDGSRGRRAGYVSRVLATVTGTESALVVNNNAGALLLVLLALATGRSVPVSRGELIEIGGSYRLPDLMRATGARLVEVGTTNRTRVSDYAEVVDADTALLLKVHPSNYRIAGFTAEASLAELAELAAETELPLVFDAGSGLVDDRTPWLPGPTPPWLSGEPGVAQAVAAGADLVLFSGDKLFGGPQAGIIVGRANLVSTLSAHPVARALRVDGPTLAALTVTADMYASGSAAELPLWKMATTPYPELEARARRLSASLDVPWELRPGSSTVGAGSVPGSAIPSPLVFIPGDADSRFLALLAADPPVLARREAGALVLDLRTVEPALDAHVAAALSRACLS